MLKIEATGYVGRDAEIKEIGNTKKISYTVGVTQKQKNAQGEATESTQWVSCLQTYHEGSGLVNYLKKGTRVFIRGSLRVNLYNGKDGVMRIGVSCDIDQMEMQSALHDGEDYVNNGLKY